jgi:Sugar transferases involved in lipopolysaccharide synthesis
MCIGWRRGCRVVVLYRFIKRLFDIFFSLCAIITLFPISIIIAFAIKIEDGESIFFLHTRVGFNAKPIKIIKFRTMNQRMINPKQSLSQELYTQYIKEYKLDNDPRETEIGKVLRRCNLDEIPQLINVLCGNLSIVGPRPITSDELVYYSDKDKIVLLSVKPGLTGYWQTYGKGHTSYMDGSRQNMELYYIQNRSIVLDSIIIIHTIKVLLEDIYHTIINKR